jgi:hypothetical protein
VTPIVLTETGKGYRCFEYPHPSLDQCGGHSYCRKGEGYHIGWGRFCKYAFPAMILVVGLCHLYLALRYG